VIGSKVDETPGLTAAALDKQPREPLPAEPPAPEFLHLGDELRFTWPALKSLLAVTAAVVAGSGLGLSGIATPTERVRVLYLDYESCLEEHQDQLAKLMTGAGLVEPPEILYRAMTRPLAEDAAFIRTEISRYQVGLVVLDSLTPGSGAEPDGVAAAVRTLTALRSFGGVTRLALAHVSKASAEQRTGATKPFGSVFVWNLARSVWEIRGSQDEDGDELRMGLFHRKANGSRLQPCRPALPIRARSHPARPDRRHAGPGPRGPYLAAPTDQGLARRGRPDH
jgi:hypothetical protein